VVSGTQAGEPILADVTAGGAVTGPGLEGTGRAGDDLWLLAHSEVTGKPFIQLRPLGLGLGRPAGRVGPGWRGGGDG
jgi:hypothetical protein